MLNVIFAGTPDFAATALQAIVKAGFHIPLVLTQPDRPQGRGMQLQPSPVKQAATELGLSVAQPSSLRNEEAERLLQAQNADVMVVAAYGLILPEPILTIPRHGCLNIHASLLPRWRGAAPIQRAIEAGAAETGVCIMQMDAGLDTGGIISEHRYAIQSHDTATQVHNALMTLGAAAIVADLTRLHQQGYLNATPQPETGATYAAKLSKSEARINWHEPALTIERKIRAFNPTPVAWTEYLSQPLKIWRAELIPQSGTPGTILAASADNLIIACGEQALRILELQPANSKRMSAQAFLSSRTLQSGDRL